MKPRLQRLFGTTSLLLVDGIGALLSAFGVGVVLPAFQPWIGLPVFVLRMLGGVALGFAAFSLGRHLTGTGSPASLRHIAYVNLTYTVVTAAILLIYASAVTPLAVAYFLGEMAIIVALSSHELRLARRLSTEGKDVRKLSPGGRSTS